MKDEFFQTPPVLQNQYDDDALLKSYLAWRLPKQFQAFVQSDLKNFGQRVVDECVELENQSERELPVHIPYDPWGRRIDDIRMSQAWAKLHSISAEEGLVAIGYENKSAEFSRLHQFAKLYLFHASSAFYTCPLAMTDGAAKLVQLYGDDKTKKSILPNLLSRDAKIFWTSGQWMTERTGGSDVSQTSTVAQKCGDSFCLSGVKWFSSATTADIAFALARVEGDAPGGRGLSAFYLNLRNSDGSLNGIQVNRLKDKLGTKALPTAELTLTDAKAHMIGKQGHGVSTIASLFNVTRIYNAICSLSTMRRAFAIISDYSKKRKAFGALLMDHPLHQQTLKYLETELQASFHLCFSLVELLGREENKLGGESDEALLRLLTPIAKMYTGKKVVEFVSECVECMGGAGYIEDTGLPRLLRNAQVFPIWEGTTNVLSLDVLRAIEKEEAAFPAYVQDIEKSLSDAKKHAGASQSIDAIQIALEEVKTKISKKDKSIIAHARYLTMAMARIWAATKMLEYCASQGQTETVWLFCKPGLARELVAAK